MIWDLLKHFVSTHVFSKQVNSAIKNSPQVSVTQESHPVKLEKRRLPDQSFAKGTPIKLPLAFLKKLIPIGNLPASALETIDAKKFSFTPGEVVFERDSYTALMIYILSGKVLLEEPNGNSYVIDSETHNACYPLSSNTEQRFRAIALVPTCIITFPMITLYHSSATYAVNNPLINPQDVPEKLRNSLFFRNFGDAFRKDALDVPSLPDVALRLRRALQKPINIADAAKIINLDPVIAAKLIQVVNSPIYRGMNPIFNTHDAINRLGLHTTQNIITSISLYHLFSSNNAALNYRAKEIWKQSVNISSLSFSLASISNEINADEALLAGLIHNIGVLPIITYAATLDAKYYSIQELEDTIALLKGLVGEFILRKWNFPESLLQIPKQTSNWYFYETSKLQLCDIVLLARYHSLLGSSETQTLPPLNTLPAFIKLGETPLTPDMSLQALYDAKEKTSDAFKFFRV